LKKNLKDKTQSGKNGICLCFLFKKKITQSMIKVDLEFIKKKKKREESLD